MVAVDGIDLDQATGLAQPRGFRRQLVDDLAKEYGLYVDFDKHHVQGLKGWKNNQTTQQKINDFAQNLNEMKPGVYLFVEHPAYNEPEMKAYFHTGYTTVANDRDDVTRVFTS